MIVRTLRSVRTLLVLIAIVTITFPASLRAQTARRRDLTWRDVEDQCQAFLATADSTALRPEVQEVVRRFCTASVTDREFLKSVSRIAPIVLGAFRGDTSAVRPEVLRDSGGPIRRRETPKQVGRRLRDNFERTQDGNPTSLVRRRDYGNAALWGTADFVTERFQQDVGSFVAGQAVGRLCDDRGAELLPATCPVLLLARETGVMTISRRLRQALDEDIAGAPVRIALTWASDSARLSGSDNAVSAWLWLRLAIEIQRNPTPLTALVAMLPDTGSVVWAGLNEVPTARTLVMVALLARALDGDSVPDGVSAPFGEKRLWWGVRAILLSLSDPKIDGPAARLHAELWPGIDGLAPQWPALVATASALSDLVVQTDSLRARIRHRGKSESLPELRAELLTTTIERVVAVVRAAGGAVSTTWIDEGGQVPMEVAPLLAAIAAEDRLAIVDEAIALAVRQLKGTGSTESVVRTLSLANDLAQAPTPAAMETLLRATTTRRGSYAIKRARDAGWYADVGGSLGLFYGWEWENNSSGAHRHESSTVAPTLGIGVQLGRRLGGRLPLSIELMANALDLGALASYRLDPPDSASGVETPPHVGVTQVFAPSLSIAFGLGRAPVQLGWTFWGRAPELRSLRQDPGRRLTMNRTGFFIAYDLPLFHLF